MPIALGVLSVGLSVALLVGWILVIVQNLSITRQVAENTWLLVLGCASFAVIMTVLATFSIFLVREIRLVNRQTRFVDSVTHELKSPLASLKLFLATLQRDDLKAPERDRVQRMMVDDVDRLTILIDHVLEASRLAHAEDVHLIERVILAEVVESCAAGICRYYKQEPDAIRVRVPRDLILLTDRTGLETILKNLLDNAVKYSLGLDRPVEVTVDAHLDGRHVYMTIRDRGVGIPRQYLPRVRDRFYRVPHESVRKRHGTGLGLYVVSILLKLLRGRLTVESAGTDQGTVVHIRIPARSRERGSKKDLGAAPTSAKAEVLEAAGEVDDLLSRGAAAETEPSPASNASDDEARHEEAAPR